MESAFQFVLILLPLSLKKEGLQENLKSTPRSVKVVDFVSHLVDPGPSI